VVRQFLEWAANLFGDYAQFLEARVGRMACLCSRVANAPNPGREIAEHFCRQQWLDGPLNRPATFELHAHKRFRMADFVDVNSWFRCKSASLKGTEGQPDTTVVLVEQDFNTLAEQLENAQFTLAEVQQFFEKAPGELQEVLNLYFPDVEGAK
jgi:hypothetical protein